MIFKSKILYFSILFASCNSRPVVDSIYYNGHVYTVDSTFNIAEAFAVKDGKIFDTGSNEELLLYKAKNKVDLHGKFVYPGFIDAHCHFYYYGLGLKNIWLGGTKSFDAVVDTINKYKDRMSMGWISARGWDQNDWAIKAYPVKNKLDELFPDVPVFLMRIDGHAALVNQKALEIANVTASTKIDGGEIILKDGKPTGLLIDNAVDLVNNKIPKPSKANQSEAVLSAQKNCFAVGLTTVDDAGLDHEVIELIDQLQKDGSLKMRIYAMITYDSLNAAYYFKKGKYKSERLNVCSFKLYADGALGSRGAYLLSPYTDMPGHTGLLINNKDSLLQKAKDAAKYGFQLNTHCIGDAANRIMLNIYHVALNGKKDHRWRIEHAQVVAPEDLTLFQNDQIIPSVQPTHATSDMYWAEERLGPVRIKSAYAYRDLMNQNNIIADGSDFPVEDINPLFGFYAAVVRKDKNNFPAEGFQMQNALTREEALKAMTIWAAYANFEEKEKGSLEKNKFADFVILEDDIMKCAPEKIYRMKIIGTYLYGEKVY